MTFGELLTQRCARQGELCLTSLQVHLGQMSAGYQLRLRSMAGASTGDASRRRQMMRGEAIDGSTAVRRGIVSRNSAAAA
jgi:hypothetical protein